MPMNRLQADQYVKEILAHLTTWAEDNNVKVSHKRCTFDPRAGFADITLTVIGEDGMSAEEHDLIEYAGHSFTDIKPEWVGQEVLVRGRSATLYGYRHRSTKYPFLVRCGNGDVFKMPESTIVKQLSKEMPASADEVN